MDQGQAQVDLAELRLGLTNREIAERLRISVGTVNMQVHEVLEAPSARNRIEAAVIAARALAA